MTQKNILQSIQDLDTDLIVEAEFAPFRKKRVLKKKPLLILVAAVMLLGTLTGAAAYRRWSNSMQFGSYSRIQPSEQLKKQAEQTGLSVTPKETKNGAGEVISAVDQGITVSVTQTVIDQYGGTAVFRIEGFDLPEGKAPWTWWDYQVDGKEVHWNGGSQFFNGITFDADGNTVYAMNGNPVPRTGENQDLALAYQDNDGNIEFSIDFCFPETDGRYFGKEMCVTFTGFGIQGERFEDEDIMTVPGTWELRWTLEGSTQPPKKWTPNAAIGHWGLTLLEAEIGQYSMKTTYRLDETYADYESFHEQTGWAIGIAGLRLKDGTDVYNVGGSGGQTWDAQTRTVTCTNKNIRTILDPEQIAGMYFYAGYDLDDRGYRVDRPYYYIPFA